MDWPAATALPYSIHACSSFSGQYGPENILVDNPTDQRSRWSGGTALTVSGNAGSSTANRDGIQGIDTSSTSILSPSLGGPSTSSGANSNNATSTAPTGTPLREQQWLILKLRSRAILQSITFGKYSRAHPCNVREYKVHAGLSPDIKTMSLLHWGGLKNDNVPETTPLSWKNKDGIAFPCEYVCIEPLSAHSSNYNISIWYIALSGIDDDAVVQRVSADYFNYRELATNKLILKHLRQQGFMQAYDTLYESVVTRHRYTAGENPLQALENPILTHLHRALVEDGDFDEAERLLNDVAYSTAVSVHDRDLFQAHREHTPPRAEWTRLDTLPSTVSADGTMPGPRGGHQLVLLRNSEHVDKCAAIDGEDTGGAYLSDNSTTACHSLYLFGGWNGKEELCDFWRYNLESQNWHQLEDASTASAPGTCPDARSCHQMAVDPLKGDIYLIGRFVEPEAVTGLGFRSDSLPARTGSSALNDTVGSDERQPNSLAEDAQVIQNVPDAAVPIYTDTGNTTSQRNQNAALPLIDVPIRPSPADEHAQAAKFARGADLWVYHTSTVLGSRAGWERLSDDTAAQGGPYTLFDHQAQIDPAGRTMYVFGGKYYDEKDGKAHYSGLYAYHLDKRQWKCIYRDDDAITTLSADSKPGHDVENAVVPSRIGHSMLLDSVKRKLLIFAGQRVEAYLDDMWIYDLDTGTVERINMGLSSADSPESGFTQRAAMDEKRREFVLLSGLTKARTPPHHAQVRHAIWIKHVDSGHWTRIPKSAVSVVRAQAGSSVDADKEEPRARFAHQFVYDPDSDRHYLFGGNPGDLTSSARLSDFWMLKLIRTSNEEILRQCLFALRRCRFRELCQTGDSVGALQYLQTAVAEVSSAAEQDEFLSCMAELLSAGINGHSRDSHYAESPEDDASDMTTSQTLQNSREAKVNVDVWKTRTAVFEILLRYFPPEDKEPSADLLSLPTIWEAAP